MPELESSPESQLILIRDLTSASGPAGGAHMHLRLGQLIRLALGFRAEGFPGHGVVLENKRSIELRTYV